MATTVTSDNFDEFLAIGLQQWGIATEQADIEDVTVVTSIGPNDSPAYSMPMAKEQNGQYEYVKISIPDLMTSIASMVATTGFLQAPTEEEFNEIFD